MHSSRSRSVRQSFTSVVAGGSVMPQLAHRAGASVSAVTVTTIYGFAGKPTLQDSPDTCTYSGLAMSTYRTLRNSVPSFPRFGRSSRAG